MLVEVKEKGTIVLPKEAINKMRLKKGDRLEITFEEGNMVFKPVEAYPRGYVAKLQKQLDQLLKQIAAAEAAQAKADAEDK